MHTPNPEPIRLNKHLALQLGVSRREADLLIEQGDVAINGRRAGLGARFSSGDTISLKGKPLTHIASYEYALFHKPPGYVCSRRRQGQTPTIYELLPPQFHPLKPVGRLDKDSSGLLILTNDGDFAYRMTHPKFYKTKVYEVMLNHALEPLHQQMISDYGITLEDGQSLLHLQPLSNNRLKWQVTMSEGRNRQIRRTFGALGYDIIGLHRIQFGQYSLGDIKLGATKLINMQ